MIRFAKSCALLTNLLTNCRFRLAIPLESINHAPFFASFGSLIWGGAAAELIKNPRIAKYNLNQKQLRKIIKVGVLSTMNGSGYKSSHVLTNVTQRLGCQLTKDQIDGLWAIIYQMEVAKQFVRAVKTLGKKGYVYTAVSDRPVYPDKDKNGKPKGGYTLAAKAYQTYEALIISLVVESFIDDDNVCPINLEHDGLLIAGVERISHEKQRLIEQRAIDLIKERIGLEVGIELEPAF